MSGLKRPVLLVTELLGVAVTTTMALTVQQATATSAIQTIRVTASSHLVPHFI